MVGTFLGIAAVACAPMSLRGSGSVGLDEVIRRNTLARGGAEALDRVRSLQIDAEISEGGQTLQGRWTATLDGRVRVDIYADGKSVFSEGVDGAGGWMWTGGSAPAKPSVEAGRAALLNGAENHLVGWHRFAGRGHKLALMPTETIDGISYHVVEVRYATGQVSYFYVDPVTWQAVRRRDERAYHPDVDPTKQRVESRFYDFVLVDGVVASHRSADFDLATGKMLGSSRVLDRQINPPFAADHFDRNRRASATL
ncbi:MAG TPA: hypothetical protein VFZ35_05810 [Sphingomicrobium sp.]